MHRAQSLLICLSLACGTPTSVMPADDAGAEPLPDSGDPIPPSPPSCELEQLPANQALNARVLVTEDALFLAHPFALLRSSGGAPLERVTSLELPENGFIRWIAGAGDSIFVNVSSSEPRILESFDDGASWIDRTPAFATTSDRLLTDGERVLLFDLTRIHELDRESGAWTEISAAPPAEADHLALEPVGFDGDAIVANDVYRGGMVRLPRGAAAWERISGLGDWGYTSFAARDALKLTVNREAIFAFVDGGWRRARELEAPTQDVALIDAGDRFLAIDQQRVLASVDGLEWTEIVEHVGGVVPSVSSFGARIAWVNGDGLFTSDNAGADWQEQVTPITERASRIELHDGVTYVHSTSWIVSRDGVWSPLELGSDTRAMTFADEGIWECDTDECRLVRDDGGVSSRVLLPDDVLPARIFATSHGLFLAENDRWNEACYATLRAGLLRYDRPSGEWVDAFEGMRADLVPEPSSCAGRPIPWSVQNIVELDGALYASLSDSDWRSASAELATYRSTDAGAHWTEISADDSLLHIVQTDAGIFALFRGAGLVRSDDGITFTPVAHELGQINDIDALEGRLAIATDAWTGPSVFVTHDAVTFTPIAELGPVLDLDVLAGTLGAATSIRGSWRAIACY
jgi:hypothetical protein